ncbi:MAG: GNAT family N-acetyltransferase [Acidobacteriia bacterium]|nr:GNAT family N-acetyltransferase [Terriglobia bacterium]MYG03123.1 GNAT family N-acetyltransferase [Terriglobia bacterium]MYK11872.1 GNAT family N-acetyltransferase [Terriglobia bacterium]
MTIKHLIRPALRSDIPEIRSVVEDAGMFPPEMLDGMIAGYLDQTTRDIWFVPVADGQVVGFGYCEPERMTSGTWNLLAIAILSRYRGHGVGGAMMHYLENRLRTAGERILIVETMGTPAFRRTRSFYRASGYTEEARIREFYEPGSDKVVFWKHL